MIAYSSTETPGNYRNDDTSYITGDDIYYNCDVVYVSTIGWNDLLSIREEVFFGRHKDPYYYFKRTQFEAAQRLMFAVKIAMIFNVYCAEYHRRMPYSKSGFVGRAGRRKK